MAAEYVRPWQCIHILPLIIGHLRSVCEQGGAATCDTEASACCGAGVEGENVEVVIHKLLYFFFLLIWCAFIISNQGGFEYGLKSTI